MASGRLIDYLGEGLASARPASLTLMSGALGIYFATDTSALSFWTGSAWVSPSISGSVAWGAITGTLSSQTDLNTALAGKLDTTGTAAKATILATARNLNGVSFDGSTDVTIPSETIVGINAQSGTTYTLVLGDLGKDVNCSNAAAITLTVPPNSSVAFPIGSMIAISQGGAGAVTATAGAGVTLRTPNGAATTSQYDGRVLEKIGTDEWRVW